MRVLLYLSSRNAVSRKQSKKIGVRIEEVFTSFSIGASFDEYS